MLSNQIYYSIYIPVNRIPNSIRIVDYRGWKRFVLGYFRALERISLQVVNTKIVISKCELLFMLPFFRKFK